MDEHDELIVDYDATLNLLIADFYKKLGDIFEYDIEDESLNEMLVKNILLTVQGYMQRRLTSQSFTEIHTIENNCIYTKYLPVTEIFEIRDLKTGKKLENENYIEEITKIIFPQKMEGRNVRIKYRTGFDDTEFSSVLFQVVLIEFKKWQSTFEDMQKANVDISVLLNNFDTPLSDLTKNLLRQYMRPNF